jgi:NAD(P)-dependent dehydrogenase (short-subunit alcohol dehydrogenase family)
MKVAITGHTSGLGREIHTLFPDAVGFSRTNGFDLLHPAAVASMIEMIDNCDIFINNAFPAVAANSFAGMGTQTQILYDVYQSWQHHHDRLIINLGSNTSDGIKKNMWPYSAAKAGSDKACEQLSYLTDGPSVCNLRFGYIDMPHVHAFAPDAKKVPLPVALSTVKYIISTWRSGAIIRDITVIP